MRAHTEQGGKIKGNVIKEKTKIEGIKIWTKGSTTFLFFGRVSSYKILGFKLWSGGGGRDCWVVKFVFRSIRVLCEGG